MRTVYRRRGRRLIVELHGELDHHCAQQLRGEMDRQLADTAINELVFEMSGLSLMDSAGIGVILGRYKELKKRGGTVFIMNARGNVDKVVKMSGLYSIIQKIG